MQIRVVNAWQGAVMLRRGWVWTVRVRTPDGHVLDQRRLAPGQEHADFDEPPSGPCVVELQLTAFAGRSLVSPLLERLTSAALRRLDTPGDLLSQVPLMFGLPIIVDHVAVDVPTNSASTPMELNGHAGGDRVLQWRLQTLLSSAILMAAGLGAMAYFLLLIAGWLTIDWILVAGGLVTGGLAFALAMNSFVTLLRNLGQSGTAPPTGPLRYRPMVEGLAELAVGVALVALTSAGFAAALRGMQGWGLCFGEQTCGTPEVMTLFHGMLWHAADTLPLVDVVAAWNWQEPWQITAGSKLQPVAGILPFFVRIVVAVGLAQLLTDVVKRSSGD